LGVRRFLEKTRFTVLRKQAGQSPGGWGIGGRRIRKRRRTMICVKKKSLRGILLDEKRNLSPGVFGEMRGELARMNKPSL